MGSFMRNKARIARSLLEHSRYEILPTPKIEAAVLAAIPAVDDVTLTVTASPARGLAATIDLTERLVGHGYRVVPHLAARMIADRAELARLVERLQALGITDVFCPAGDADPPSGGYTGSVPLLEDLTALGHPFAQIGVTGYPEQHPAIADDVTIQSMWDKRRHATYIVSNLCFDAKVLAAWVRRMRRRGIELPVYIGMPGPVERTKLIAMATKIGVGQSARFLRTHASSFARIAAPGGYDPERFLTALGGLARDPEAGVAGLHLFTFNQIAETEQWRRTLLGQTTTSA
jgi:methylenetetrahydrofolate reductase (NADPH)